MDGEASHERAGAQWPAPRAHASFLDRHNGKPTGSTPPALVPMQRPVLVRTSSRAADQLEPFRIRPRRSKVHKQRKDLKKKRHYHNFTMKNDKRL